MAKKDQTETLNKTLYSQLFPAKLTKSDLRKIQILEAAIKTYAAVSIDDISYEDLARLAKISRPLIIHHFPNKKDLFGLVVKFIRAQMQEIAVREIQNGRQDAKSRLENYVGSTFKWLEKYPNHMRTWLFHFFLCSSDSGLRQSHLSLTKIGTERIVVMLKQGVAEGIFLPGHLPAKAKAIQRMITGALVEAITELEPKAWAAVGEQCIADCLGIVCAAKV